MGMMNCYELYTDGEIGQNMEFWEPDHFLEQKNSRLNFYDGHNGYLVYSKLIEFKSGCYFETERKIVSQLDLMKLSKLYPMLNVVLFFCHSNDNFFSNGDGLCGLWLAKGGKIMYSLEACLRHLYGKSMEELIEENDPFRILTNSLIEKANFFKLRIDETRTDKEE
jgi:hypothetical protein